MTEIIRIAIQGKPFAYGTLSDITDRQFGYYGTDKAKVTSAPIANVTSVVRDSKHMQYVLYSDGTEVARFGIRQRIWIGEQVAPALPQTSKHVKSVALCLCGCGQRVQRTYKQGHDARHASAVAERVLAVIKTDPQIETNSLMLALPTDALRAKAARIVAHALAA